MFLLPKLNLLGWEKLRLKILKERVVCDNQDGLKPIRTSFGLDHPVVGCVICPVPLLSLQGSPFPPYRLGWKSYWVNRHWSITSITILPSGLFQQLLSSHCVSHLASWGGRRKQRCFSWLWGEEKDGDAEQTALGHLIYHTDSWEQTQPSPFPSMGEPWNYHLHSYQ